MIFVHFDVAEQLANKFARTYFIMEGDRADVTDYKNGYHQDGGAFEKGNSLYYE